MEPKRIVIAFVLCAAVLVIHYWLIMPNVESPPEPEPTAEKQGTSDDGTGQSAEISDKKTETKPPPREKKRGPDAEKPVPTPEKPKPEPEKPKPEPEKPKPEPEKPIVTTEKPPTSKWSSYRAGAAAPLDNALVLANEHLTTRWTNRFTGACLDVSFNEFYTTIKREEKWQPLGAFQALVLSDETERTPRFMTLESPELPALAGMTMKVVEHTDTRIVFEGTLERHVGDGKYVPYLEVKKTVTLAKDKDGSDRYEVVMKLDMKNVSGEDMKLSYAVTGVEGFTVEGASRQGATARYAFLSKDRLPVLKEQALAKFEQDEEWGQGDGGIIWAGVDDRYFAALLMVDNPRKKTVHEATITSVGVRMDEETAADESVTVKLATRVFDLPKEGKHSLGWRLFVGPKKTDVLEQYSTYGLPRMVDFGMFGFISRIILWLLRRFQMLIGNWGFSIIFLTILIRLCLHPLTKKSQISMHKMQRLKPLISELQKKYKNDRQKLGQEQMKLFREHGVSPFGGCLPILLQLPILFALFWALRLTFELRQSPFIWWMKDLSIPDTVGHFPLTVPFIGGAGVNILPILMTAAMFIQQRLMPKSDDPQAQQQQKIMVIFPLFLLFVCYTFPSGVCLYWFTSTGLGTLEQVYIRRHLDAIGETPTISKKPSSPKGKKRK